MIRNGYKIKNKVVVFCFYSTFRQGRLVVFILDDRYGSLTTVNSENSNSFKRITVRFSSLCHFTRDYTHLREKNKENFQQLKNV